MDDCGDKTDETNCGETLDSALPYFNLLNVKMFVFIRNNELTCFVASVLRNIYLLKISPKEYLKISLIILK